jgi:hypothetical protein
VNRYRPSRVLHTPSRRHAVSHRPKGSALLLIPERCTGVLPTTAAANRHCPKCQGSHALHQDHHTRAGYQPRPDPDPGPASRKISFTKLSPPPEPSRFLHHHNRAKLEIPIGHRRSPAGSCLGGFRTPAHTHRRDLRWPASENLHHSRHSADPASVSEADTRGKEVPVRLGVESGPTKSPLIAPTIAGKPGKHSGFRVRAPAIARQHKGSSCYGPSYDNPPVICHGT